jgi:hypothetical protein
MAIGKWCMYLTAVLFLVVGLGALAVAAVPGTDEWVAEQTLDASGLSSDSPIRDDAVNAVTNDDIGGVRFTAWILAGTFLPTALLFVWCGRWFKSMEGGFGGMSGASIAMAANAAAPSAGQDDVVPAGGGRTAAPTVAAAGSPLPDLTDPTAGGIIS